MLYRHKLVFLTIPYSLLPALEIFMNSSFKRVGPTNCSCSLEESLSPYSQVLYRWQHRKGHHNPWIDRDGEAPCNMSKRRPGGSVPTLIGAMGDTIKEDRLVKKILEPRIRNMVGEEVTTVLERHLLRLPRQNLDQRAAPEGRRKDLQLRFKESPSEAYTGSRLGAKNGASLEVALYQCDGAGVQDRIVTEGPLSNTRIELCVLQGSFGSDGREDWSSEDFRDSILRDRRRGGLLLDGDRFLRLKNGVGILTNLRVTDGSKYDRTGKFRLGARVAEPNPNAANVREGVSQPFKVKDGRGLSYQKYDIPSLNDEIWRLEGIAKGGKRHNELQSKGVTTVEAFLNRLNTDPNQLKQDLGKIGEKTWKKLILHAAKACARHDATQPFLSTGPLVSEPQHLVGSAENLQARQGLPQHELLPLASQGLSVLSASTSHFGESSTCWTTRGSELCRG
ncbi:calmodulin-binding protein 60 B-like isoform X2 [Prosopis cineraria]|uniref:calmodulin-binding protein 60 B-like isoform X2 n=1 Tax=Prosopis cineraria TaxID=364024 RepID=UPI0024101E1A|nr:calmodulin-binding protein 60 B-like isoform X2 [Prosopis cineraria]